MGGLPWGAAIPVAALSGLLLDLAFPSLGWWPLAFLSIAGGLWTLGPRPDLLGMRPGGRPRLAGARVSIDKPSRLGKVRPSSGSVPSLLSGVVSGVGGHQEIEDQPT